MSDTTDNLDTGSSKTFNYGILVVFGLVMIYMAYEAFRKSHNCLVLHEGSLVMLLGFGISYALYASGKSLGDNLAIADNLIYFLVLPPIIFATGFNLQRKRVLENLTNILLLGLLGTLVTFVSLVGFTVLYTNKWAEDGFSAIKGYGGEEVMV